MPVLARGMYPLQVMAAAHQITYRASPQSEPCNSCEDVKASPAPSTTACGDIRAQPLTAQAVACC